MFFCFVVQSILSYLVSAKLVLSLPFFVLCVSAIFLHAPLTNIWKVLNSVSRSWVFRRAKSWNSKQWSVGLFGKDLKGSFFLGHIYVVLFVELHTFSFLFFNLVINHFSLSICTLNSHGVNYILSPWLLHCTAAGCKENHFYSLPFGQDEASIY